VESDADVHADHWEMHPQADEAVCCLAGSVRLLLRPGGDEEMVALAAGGLVVIPRGRWHRFEVDAPSDLMSVSLRDGTRLEQHTGGRSASG
jgi:quercetin dioxygenase-like cupin family protein